MKIIKAVVVLLSFMSFLQNAQAANAIVEVCNRTTSELYLIIAYGDRSDSEWREERGWYKLTANSCSQFSDISDDQFTFSYAANSGELWWTGSGQKICYVKGQKFTFNRLPENGCPNNPSVEAIYSIWVNKGEFKTVEIVGPGHRLETPEPQPQPQPTCAEGTLSGTYLCVNGTWRNVANCSLNLLKFACEVDEAVGLCHWVDGSGCKMGPRR